jgi:hypothetical protein
MILCHPGLLKIAARAATLGYVKKNDMRVYVYEKKLVWRFIGFSFHGQ